MNKSKELNVNINAAIHNRFDVEVRDSQTGELKQKAQAFNVICNALWTKLFTPANYFNYILYGSGSGTPAATDTTLFTKIAGASASTPVTNLDYPNGTFSLRKQIQIDEQTAVGETLTEVGIGYDDTHIVTHAMLQDMNGNPITITKTNTDIITIYATVFVHFNPAGYQNGKILLLATIPMFSQLAGSAPDSYYTIFRYSNNIYPGKSRSYGSLGYISMSAVTFNEQAKTITMPATRFSVSQANGPIRGFSFMDYAGNPYGEQFVLFVDASAFGYSNFAITGEAVGTGDGQTTDFNTAFPVGSNAKVYVNGVEDQSATVIASSSDYYNAWRFLLSIDENGNPFSDRDIDGTVDIYSNTAYHYYSNPSHISIDTIIDYNTNTYGYKGYIVESSNDLQTWTTRVDRESVGYTESTLPAPVNDLYWRFAWKRGYTALKISFVNKSYSPYNIHFSTPPAAGAVITADYIPDCIPKDSDHVFDLSFTMTLGEYTEP